MLLLLLLVLKLLLLELLLLVVSRVGESCSFAQELLLSLLLLLQLELAVVPLLPAMSCPYVFLLLLPLPLLLLLLLLLLEQNVPTLLILLLRRPRARARSSRHTSALLPGSSRSVPHRLLLYELRNVGTSFPRRVHCDSSHLLDAEPLLLVLARRVGRGVRSLSFLARC